MEAEASPKRDAKQIAESIRKLLFLPGTNISIKNNDPHAKPDNDEWLAAWAVAISETWASIEDRVMNDPTAEP